MTHEELLKLEELRYELTCALHARGDVTLKEIERQLKNATTTLERARKADTLEEWDDAAIALINHGTEIESLAEELPWSEDLAPSLDSEADLY